MVKAKQDYVIFHPKQKEVPSGPGLDTTMFVDDKQLSILTISKRISQTQYGDPQKFIAALMHIDGIDAIQPLGVYTIQIVIANTFDYDEVLEDVKAVLERAVSALIIPSNSNAAKIQV